MSAEDLKKKIKKALDDSGFPLELNISKILKSKKWIHTLCARYEDFETGVLRELDISAHKTINGIAVHLQIECKKSSNKQLILYAQHKSQLPLYFINYFKFFPVIIYKKGPYKLKDIVLNELEDLPILKHRELMSKSVIFTRGDKIEQNNDNFFSSLNGIIKKSIVDVSDGYVETGCRIICLHILVYDGLIFLMSNAENEDYELIETEYGQYKFDYRFKISQKVEETPPDFLEIVKFFSHANVIEIMTPKYFEKYLADVENAILNVEKKKIKEWGNDWD